MTVKTTQSKWELSITQWHMNCNRTRSSLMFNTTTKPSIINNTITTPFWNLETTTSDTLSTINEIVIMVSAIFGMVVIIILYAAAYRLFSDTSYHDTHTKGAVHVALTLFTYVLYLFDTLSDVLLFIHYISIAQIFNFVLVMAFTLAPIIFLEFIFAAKWHKKWKCGYANPSDKQKPVFKMFGLVLVLIFSPLAALLPTFTYAQVLAIGKDDNGFGKIVKKSSRKKNDHGREKGDTVKRQSDNEKEDNVKGKDDNGKDDNKKEKDGNGKDDNGKENDDNGKGKDDNDNYRITFAYLASYLTLVEATLESAPQLTIQLYLSITDTSTDTTSTRFIRYMSIVASSLALAWSLTAFSHQYRETKHNQPDSFDVKFFHWVSRIAEIVPRILLIALITAEYGGYVMYFILYRLVFSIIYAMCEISAVKDDFELEKLPDILLGIIGNLFCFSVSDIYKGQKRDNFGGKFFAGYYTLFYAENGALLYLWYSDAPVLLQIKVGGACSNHEWFLPYVFVVVILGFAFQILFLCLYYWKRNKKKEEIYNVQRSKYEKGHNNDSTKRERYAPNDDEHVDIC